MTESFASTRPIYLQLADRINRQIVRGDLKLGDKLPSVREMAIESNVNPNTVQRTYRELEAMGVAESRRGQGTFVREDVHMFTELKENLKREEIEEFVRVMHELGLQDQEIQTSLAAFLNRTKEENDD
ncbi:GntR family transcriptional regulator [Salsuginibacillus kocurii]|uniref:GntR family transcriptional regulator n=1 Tax=Salsuginibacillus kocurii TaxID=427078 RepID=UPI00037E88E1|nr:GntR family transcriptional regulator [Salsuginibacillus kocurii]